MLANFVPMIVISEDKASAKLFNASEMTETEPTIKPMKALKATRKRLQLCISILGIRPAMSAFSLALAVGNLCRQRKLARPALVIVRLLPTICRLC